ncbi:hypothetical protein GUITHDRAFT_115674 [Guillardia theta CCMP2712]|uniref:EF-hand domain-containing protein n=1 Tax=Guillardia theta (strain CCMP2712) TaxID=905079 RepID=L1IPA6_GUITC|nr:hypothetical protein GUITHDRAFT_115674 [Guillardia theta CCMP2712]EKX38121.1 hypothetical protein GUITHDRAFT_115674 [Guillardia theta CCMP2712]|eukprot:XP_005825101.1 hypothetical protein GUITHDRAFT_115674 [Guillardia theta CCMP2712]
MRAFSLCSLLVRFILSSTWADPLRASHGVDIAHGYHPSSLKLRGGSGVYDGLLQSAPGLGEVSEYLEGLAPLGDTCGDPANVPADITSNQFLDSLNPQSLYELIGSERPESEVGIDTPEFQAQGRNFIKAHTIRGALMFLEDSKFFVPFVKAIFNKFDSNQDGFLSFEDFQELQLCTEPGIELGEKNLTEWEEFLNETEDSLETGMSFFGLYRLYQSTGQDVIQDCQVVFGDKFYDMFPYARWLFDNHTMSNDEDQPACNGYKRWQLEDIDAPLTEDVWDIGDLESCVRPENSFWHEWNWSAFDCFYHKMNSSDSIPWKHK